jgi:uncharacterized membrane protein YhaH (DUF805 family)
MSERFLTRNPETSAVKGPFEHQDIRRALQDGELRRDIEVRSEAEADWVRVVDHPAFRAASSSATFAGAGSRQRRRATQVDPNNPYATLAEDQDFAPSAAPSWPQILFSFRGRIPRRHYWATRLFAMLLLMTVGVLFSSVRRGGDGAGVVIVAVYVVFFWILLAGSVKRWHDLDKSGMWIFISMVPLIGGLWEFIEAGCSRGTQGPNRYGADPT